MALILSVINRAKLLPDQTPQMVFDERGGSIGRSPLNKWIICDQQRFISSKHANIFFRDGKFYLTDTSTNGVFVNKSSRPLGANNSIALKNGDHIALGELEISAEVRDAAVANAVPPPAPEASRNPPVTQDILGQLGIGNAKEDEHEGAFPDLSDLINAPRGPVIANVGADEEVLDPLALLGVSPKPRENFATLDTGEPKRSQASLVAYNPPTPVNQPMELPHRATPQDFAATPNFLPDDWDLLESAAPQVQTAPEAAVVVATPATAQESKPVPRPADASTTVREILLAAHIDPDSLGDKLDKLAPQLFGAMLRATMDGLVTTLLARSQIKSGMRMSVTMIGQRENNPLKFSINGEEALHNLLQQRAGYLDPVQAIEKGFKDLQSHQLAVMAAMQTTVIALLERFDPVRLAVEFDKLKASALFAGKKAHYWECYEEYFKKLQQELHEDFQTVLGSVFADAYQEQMHKLG